MVGYSGNKGGVERYIDNLTAALPQYEFVLSLPEMEIAGKRWKRPPNRHRYVRYRLFWERFFKENHFDALYFNTCDMVSIDMLRFAKRAGIPVRIIHAHNSGTQQAAERKMSLFHRLMEWHSRKQLGHYATHFFACSKKAGDWMFDGRPYTLIRNGIDLPLYAFCEEKRGALRTDLNLKDELLVGIVGRLSVQKNPLFAVKVLEELIEKKPDARAVFLGDGSLMQKAVKEAEEAGIRDHVCFMGNVDNVNAWLSAMDVLLMPSLFEGFPYVLIEAQANGLPCIVSSEISQEADMTGLIQFVDLKLPPDIWAEKLCQTAGKRKKGTERLLDAAGYDCTAAAKTVAGIFETIL